MFKMVYLSLFEYNSILIHVYFIYVFYVWQRRLERPTVRTFHRKWLELAISKDIVNYINMA